MLEIAGISLVILLILIWVVLEVPYRFFPGNALVAKLGSWNLEVYEPQHYRLVGEHTFRNPNRKLEVMIPELKAEVTLLAKGSLGGITHSVRILSQHADAEARPDEYWFAYIVKSRHQTTVEVTVDITGPNLSILKAAWVRVAYTTYGPKGLIPKVQHAVIPLRFPDPAVQLQWHPVQGGQVLPIPTHLLTPLDTCSEVVRRYVAPHARAGDIITIGETPVAIMQGRFRHHRDIQPSWVARRVCYFFFPTSSLATACGLQTLVDIVGPVRVLFAFLGGVIGKLLRQPGMFYRLAGEQARLIDDVTGTLPPFDQFIILGPENPQQVVDQVKVATGLATAIVDVNDLRAVKVLAATTGVSRSFLTSALRANPAGNADEQTPLVLLRPDPQP